jgi:glycosyltransferase involved in cell wall biosynthesis/protein-tyrosine-phosphatase
MRICHVMTADLWAGAEVQLATTASYLVEQPDLRVFAVLFNDGRLASELRQLGVEVAVFDETRLGSLRIVRSLTALLRERQIDLVHTHRYKDTVLGTIAATLAGVPHVIRTMHGLREPMTGWDHLKFRGYEVMEKVMVRCFADRVVAVSKRMAATLTDEGYPSALVTAIPNGIDLRKVVPTRTPADVRRELAIDDRDIVIGTAGRLSPVKGHDSFLRAAALILREEPRARFLLAGGGPLEHQLKALASELGIAAACRFVGARSDVYDLVAAMDMFVLPSLNEGLPMAILEAMALGTPVVATDVGGLPEVIRHCATGLLVPPGDERALADACVSLARDPERARELANQGRRVVEDRFSHRQQGRALVETYHGVRRDYRRDVSVIGLGVGLARRAAEYAARSARHAIERWQMHRMRRSPAALMAALRAGKTILVVCHGNIIRSPFAASLLAQALGERTSVSIASAGLEAMPGRPPHPTALATAAARRVDLSSHAASRLDPGSVAKSDVIFVMEIPQLLALRRRFPEARAKTFLLSCLAPDTPLEIRDPVDGSEPVFEACFDHITQAVRPVVGVLSHSAQHP